MTYKKAVDEGVAQLKRLLIKLGDEARILYREKGRIQTSVEGINILNKETSWIINNTVHLKNSISFPIGAIEYGEEAELLYGWTKKIMEKNISPNQQMVGEWVLFFIFLLYPHNIEVAKKILNELGLEDAGATEIKNSKGIIKRRIVRKKLIPLPLSLLPLPLPLEHKRRELR